MQEDIFSMLEIVRVPFTQIEGILNMPKNYLSRFKNPKNKMPEKWVTAMNEYLEKEFEIEVYCKKNNCTKKDLIEIHKKCKDYHFGLAKTEKIEELPTEIKEVPQNKPQIDKIVAAKVIVPKQEITPEIKQEPSKDVENQSDVFNFEGVAFFNIENYTKFPLSQKPKTQVEYDAWKSAKKKDDERIKKLYNEYKSKKINNNGKS